MNYFVEKNDKLQQIFRGQVTKQRKELEEADDFHYTTLRENFIQTNLQHYVAPKVNDFIGIQDLSDHVKFY